MIITNNKAYLVHEEDKTPHAFTQSDFEAFLPDGEEQSLEKIYVPQNLLSEYQELNEFFASRMEPYNFNTKRVTKPEYYYFNELTLTDAVMEKVLDGSIINTVRVPMSIRKGYNMYHFPFDVTREELLREIDFDDQDGVEKGITLPEGWREFSSTSTFFTYPIPIPSVVRANIPFMFKSKVENATAELVFENKTLKTLQEPLLYKLGQTNCYFVAHTKRMYAPTSESHTPFWATSSKGNFSKFNSGSWVQPFRSFIEQRNY